MLQVTKEILKNPYPGEALENYVQSEALHLREVITEIMCVRNPTGYKMHLKHQDEWDLIVAVVNQGIDSHLEAFTRSTFENGHVWIHPEEMGIFVDRLRGVVGKLESCCDDGRENDCNGDDCPFSKGESFLSCILHVLMSED